MKASRRPPGSLVALLASSTLVLNACGVLPFETRAHRPAPVRAKVGDGDTAAAAAVRAANGKANDVVLFALGLIETGYQFGGKNPEAGLDCSGLVTYVFNRAANIPLHGSAADLARQGTAVPTEQLRPGDLVFFNTRNRPRSHVGIYIGDDRFVHAPKTNGKVRTESLKNRWFAARFEGGRTYFD
ncbi:MAG: C40 family peptidase [Sulfuritalea sp.]|nr:C40 family peptidase [Sulfuritalea sp.]